MRIVYDRECCKYYDDLLPGVCLKRAIRQIRNRAGTWKCTMECDEFELYFYLMKSMLTSVFGFKEVGV